MSNLANLEVKESSTLSIQDLGSNKVFRYGSGRSKGNKDVQLMPFDALCVWCFWIWCLRVGAIEHVMKCGGTDMSTS